MRVSRQEEIAQEPAWSEFSGAIVHWASNRQSGSVLSVHEAELNGAITGTKIGIAIREVVQDMTETTATLKLDQDNQATITTIMNEVTSWS